MEVLAPFEQRPSAEMLTVDDVHQVEGDEHQALPLPAHRRTQRGEVAEPPLFITIDHLAIEIIIVSLDERDKARAQATPSRRQCNRHTCCTPLRMPSAAAPSALEDHLEASLALAILRDSASARRPQPGSLIHYSNRGVQYA
jgi:hypothetical protein